MARGLIDVVENHPDVLSSMFVDDGDGTYGVRFYVGGNEYGRPSTTSFQPSMELLNTLTTTIGRTLLYGLRC